MSLSTFKGGTHPYEGKELSEDKAIRELSFDGDYVFPMSQGIGAPAKPVVNVGDHVLAGQKIAEAGGFVSANVISSVSGTVKIIQPRMTTGGVAVNSVVVTSDGLFETIEGIGTERDWTCLDKETIVGIIKDAGIVGIGGAGFPTHVKLMPKNPDAIEFFIANGSECEPMLTSDYRLMLEEGEKIVEGLKICMSMFPQAKGIIGIENNKPKAIEHMKELCAHEPNIEVKELLTKYPEGGERQLINACTGRFINSSMLPADAGCIVDNVATLAAIYDAVALSTPLMQKVITVSGDAVKETANVKVRLGSSYKRILDEVGGLKEGIEDAGKYLCGGPMMGQALFDLDVPVTKPSSAICAFIHDEVSENPTTACIRCGRCVDVCPEFLVPALMQKAAAKHDLEKFEELNGMECMECGSCSYICPARRPLTQSFKEMRKLVAAQRKIKAEERKLREQQAAAAAAAAKEAEEKKEDNK
ncbi:MAG: electron transport complex subunit RsxC [Lachnospiraceae bacterium]|nr:electron transport complex subunit RsxC [Lachnospiraceae bacterium]